MRITSRRGGPGLVLLVLAITVLFVGPGPATAAPPCLLEQLEQLATTPAAKTTDHPNIMVVMLDDMRADELKYAPNVRRYVRDRGLDFANAFSPFPLCCPARASFLLGQYAHNHRVLYHDAPYGFGSIDDSLTIGGRMQEAGYQTALVGKYLNRYGDQPSRVTGRPSEHYVPAGWTDWMVGLETPFRPGSPNYGNTYSYFNFTQNINGRTVPHHGEYSSTVIADEVRRLIGKYHRAGKPFFMWVTPVAPHHGSPVEADDPPLQVTSGGRHYEIVTPARPDWVKGRFDTRIKRAPGQPRSGPSDPYMRNKPWNLRKWPEATDREKAAMRTAARQRAEAVFAWDREFGRIIDRLKRTGEYDDTIVVFTSDNGYFLGEHRQRQGKIKAHEPSLRVPLVVAGPGIARGVRYAPITTVDLTATILDIARARPLPAMDGISRYGVMTGADQAWDTPVVTEGRLEFVPMKDASWVDRGLTTSGLRTGRFKLVKYADKESELYDLVADPNELRNVWNDPAYRQVRTQMRDVWRQVRACRGDECRRPLPRSLQTGPALLQWQHANAVWRHRWFYDR